VLFGAEALSSRLNYLRRTPQVMGGTVMRHAVLPRSIPGGCRARLRKMDESALLGLTALAVFAIGWLLPILVILSSSRTNGGEKFAWVLAVLFVSWFAWVFYLLLAPIKNRG
jgi:hypothetical protein